MKTILTDMNFGLTDYCIDISALKSVSHYRGVTSLL